MYSIHTRTPYSMHRHTPTIPFSVVLALTPFHCVASPMVSGGGALHMLRFWQSHCTNTSPDRHRRRRDRKIVDIIQFNNKTMEMAQDQCALWIGFRLDEWVYAPQSTYFSTKSTSKPKNIGKKNNNPLLNVQLLNAYECACASEHVFTFWRYIKYLWSSYLKLPLVLYASMR